MTKEMQSKIAAYENAEVLSLALDNPAPDYEPCVFTGGSNGEIRIWDAWTGSLVQKIRAHAGNVNPIAFFVANDDLLFSSGKIVAS